MSSSSFAAIHCKVSTSKSPMSGGGGLKKTTTTTTTIRLVACAVYSEDVLKSRVDSSSTDMSIEICASSKLPASSTVNVVLSARLVRELNLSSKKESVRRANEPEKKYALVAEGKKPGKVRLADRYRAVELICRPTRKFLCVMSRSEFDRFQDAIGDAGMVCEKKHVISATKLDAFAQQAGQFFTFSSFKSSSSSTAESPVRSIHHHHHTSSSNNNQPLLKTTATPGQPFSLSHVEVAPQGLRGGGAGQGACPAVLSLTSLSIKNLSGGGVFEVPIGDVRRLRFQPTKSDGDEGEGGTPIVLELAKTGHHVSFVLNQLQLRTVGDVKMDFLKLAGAPYTPDVFFDRASHRFLPFSSKLPTTSSSSLASAVLVTEEEDDDDDSSSSKKKRPRLAAAAAGSIHAAARPALPKAGQTAFGPGGVPLGMRPAPYRVPRPSSDPPRERTLADEHTARLHKTYASVAGSASKRSKTHLFTDSDDDDSVAIVSTPRRSSRLSSSQSPSSSAAAKVLFHYPNSNNAAAAALEGLGFDTLTMRQADRDCLRVGEYLNDSVIDFYAKYCYRERVLQSACTRQDVHVMSSFLFSTMDRRCARFKPGKFSFTAANNQQHQEAQFAVYARVRYWSRGVDLFAKRFLLLPINKGLHWSLAIVHLEEPAEEGGAPPKLTVYTLDSLDKFHDPQRVSSVIRLYLEHEWRARALALQQPGGTWPLPARNVTMSAPPSEEEEEDASSSDDECQIVEAPGKSGEGEEDRFVVTEPVFAGQQRVLSLRVPMQTDGVNCGVYALRNLQEFVGKYESGIKSESLFEDEEEKEKEKSTVRERLEAVFANLVFQRPNDFRRELQALMDKLQKEEEAA